MSAHLIQMIKVNNLQYNPNRDPQVYRRVVGHPFRIQAMLRGEGQAKVTVTSEGKVLKEATVDLPGIFSCELTFNNAATRIATIAVTAGGSTQSADLRLDTEAHAKVG